MNTISLATQGAIEELPKLLEGQTLQQIQVTPDRSGASRLTVELTFGNGAILTLEAGPLRRLSLTADVALPQFVGAAELPPPQHERFKLRAV